MNIQGNVADLVVGNAVTGTLADDLPTLFGYGIPVSYTHLDVYKRQVNDWCPVTRESCRSFIVVKTLFVL